jgi:hypothetical protein
LVVTIKKVVADEKAHARINMSLKLQTMANEYFEIMIILKNLRTEK